MSYDRWRDAPPPPSAGPRMIAKIVTVGVILLVLLVLWRTGGLITIRNWAMGLVGQADNAVTDSQQTFQQRLARSREAQGRKSMGTGDTQ